MRYRSPLKIRDRKAFLKELSESKKRNFEDNLKFVKLRAEWMKRKSNKEWSRRQKVITDEVYRANRKLKLNLKGA